MKGLRVFCVFVRLLLAAVLIGLPAEAAAQYFGRNKVEYANFDFRVLTTEHFDVYYYATEEPAARMAARMAERWYARFSHVLNHQLHQRQPLVLYGSQAEFAQTNVVSGLVPESVGGVTESLQRRIVMPFAPTMAETNRVLGHEIVHAFQFDIARGHGGTGLPLWFIEGMAEYLARGSVDSESDLWLRDMVLGNRLPSRQRDAATKLSPYQYGHAFWSYLAQRYGDQVIEKSLKPDKKHRKLTDRIRYATGADLDTLYSDWVGIVQCAYDSNTSQKLPRWSTGASNVTSRAGSMQLGPALSPDGKHAVFFSERDRLSLDLYLADVDGRRIVRKLATTAASAQFDSLQSLRSAGAWSPDSEWFAFPAVRQGHAALMLLDMRGRGRDREIMFNRLGQVLAPTWSPDGTSIAFSALAGGFTDLYVFNLSTGVLRQLTDDAFADLQPAWSHDGRTIAFVTERYSSELNALRFGQPQLATFDVQTKTLQPVAVGPSLGQLNPQWSMDDRDLYFVSDTDGTRNVFRLSLDSSTLHQVTEVGTGISGLTPTSPAISVASRSPMLAVTVFEAGRPQLVVINGPNAIAGKPLAMASSEASAASADEPPARMVNRSLRDDQNGLPNASSVVSRTYSSKLSLEGIGQPYLSSGGGPFGNFVRGGGAVMFGDMLGQRRLGAAVQIGNRLHDAAFAFRFVNQKRRWNWGAIAELEPGIGRYRRHEAVVHQGEPAVLKQADYLQRMQLRTAALVAYPFNRGLRVEFTGGVRHGSYHREVRSEIVSDAGKVLARDQSASSGGPSTTMAEVGAAIVHDTTMFGPTAPILGSRYRFEIAPAVGNLSYTRLLADYRRYLMPIRPYTIALRVLHSARYGGGGDDPRLLSSFLGSTYLVRGHRRDLRYCQPDPTHDCQDELLGSRLLVSNLEVRFPLWGMFSRQIEYGPLPADGFLFADGGLVWSGSTRKTGISSFGGGIRLNAGGLPFELAAIRALDGPAPRWQFDFGFRVGF